MFAFKQSTKLSLVLVNSALLAVAFGLLLLLVVWLANHFMQAHVEESLASELAILTEDWKDLDGRDSIIRLIKERMQQRAPNHDRLYRLEKTGGAMIVGNVPVWPPAALHADVRFTMPSRKFPGETVVLAQFQDLAGGYRLLVGFDEIETARVNSSIENAALIALGVMLALSLVVGYIITGAALKPVHEMTESAQKIMHGDLSHRIATRANGDEFDELGNMLNAMLDRITQLLESVKGATDNIAHDLRTPLTRLRARLELAGRESDSAATLTSWNARNISDLDQILATFNALLRIGGVESGLLRQEFYSFDILAVVRDAIEYVEPFASDKNIQIVLQIDAELEKVSLHGHHDLLFQAVINLLDNAIKFSPSASVVDVEIVVNAKDMSLRVRDQGLGIPLQDRTRVFERLVRLDVARGKAGLGLGLALVRAIAQLHEGSVSILDNANGVGVCLCLNLAIERAVWKEVYG